jgi:hypothetical protein
MANEININGNVNPNASNAPNNVYLAAGKTIEVTADLKDGLVGVTTATEPAASVNGVVNTGEGAKEVVAAVPSPDFPGASVADFVPPFAENFFSDKDADTNADGELDHETYYATVGTGAVSNSKNVVIRLNGYTITFTYLDDDTGSPMANIGSAPTSEIKTGGTSGITYPNPNLEAETGNTGYVLQSVAIEEPTTGGPYFTADNVSTSANFGRVTGTMPTDDVTFTYTYKLQQSAVNFHALGGTPNPFPRTGAVGTAAISSTNPAPAVTRSGYTFSGWSTVNPNSGTPVMIALPLNFTVADIDLYAVFAPDTSTKFAYTVGHTNANGSIVFQRNTISGTFGLSVTQTFSPAVKPVPGYNWIAAPAAQPSPMPITGNFVSPAAYDFNGDGTTDGVSGTSTEITGWFNTTPSPAVFAGKMPAMDLTVNFGYSVDASVTQPLTLNFIKEDGTTLAPSTSTGYAAEATITASPVIVGGWKLKTAVISQGAVGNPDDSPQPLPHPYYDTGSQAVGSHTVTVQGLTSGVTGNYFAAAPDWGVVNAQDAQGKPTGVFNGKMPNQPVTIDYIYEPSSERYDLVVRYQDRNTADSRLATIMPNHVEDNGGAHYIPTTPVTYTFLPIYGYVSTLPGGWTDVFAPTSGVGGSFNAGRDFSGTIPMQDVNVTYGYARDTGKWATITYKPTANGKLETMVAANVSQDVSVFGTSGDASYTAMVLGDDSSAAAAAATAAGHGPYTWADIQAKRLLPTPTANQYYMFDGWFIDADGNGKKGSGEPYLTGTETFTSGSAVTIMANFVEDPAYWIDVYFSAGSHGAIAAGQITFYHTTIDKTWGDVVSFAPITTPEVNYLRDGWYYGGARAVNSMALTNGDQFIMKFVKDPVVWGLNVQPPEAGGSLHTDGSGRVTVYDTDAGYRYIVTDMSGNIVAVGDGDASGRLNFDGLTPGTRYNVYEATQDAVATVGSDISTVTGTAISGPTNVRTPVVEDNYQVQYDDGNEGKAKIVINPADPDAEYGLLDKNGNVVFPPEVDADGWEVPSGSGPQIVFSNLEPGEEYTVVARKKGDTAVTVVSKYPDGDVILADPGGDLDIPTFIVATQGGGWVDTVSGSTVGVASYDQTHKDEIVTIDISPSATNALGEPFDHWRLLTGQVDGVARVQPAGQTRVTFTMPATNVTWGAYYTPTANLALVTDEVRGGNPGEMALDPDEVDGLRTALTTPDDLVLINTNHAEVTYKVVYNKNKATSGEVTAIKGSGLYDMTHDTAFTAAWGLDVEIERYVDNRLVPPATPSSAYLNATFDTYVQLNASDLDMMEYQLYEIDYVSGAITAVSLEAISDDPLDTGGLFTFTAHAFCRYVLVYNKAFKVTFTNNHASPIFRHTFKVRKGEWPDDGNYTGPMEYSGVVTPVSGYTDSNGVEYVFRDWSYDEATFRAFDDQKPVTKRTFVYAYYNDNKAQLDSGRQALEDLISELAKIANDYFLKNAESVNVKDIIAIAQALLDKTGPKATIGEIQALMGSKTDTIDTATDPDGMDASHVGPSGTSLYAIVNYYGYDVVGGKPGILYTRYTNYGVMQGGTNSGGLGGGGGQYDNGGSSLYGGPSTGAVSAAGSSGVKSSGSSSSSGGGGGGSSSGGSGARYSAPVGSYIPTPAPNYIVGTNGNWELLDGTVDQWIFTLNGGIRLTNRWADLDWASGDVNKNGWYHFNSHGIMDIGWFKDALGNWYYCQTERDGWLGKMKVEWHLDHDDGHWYYLDPQTGIMETGWREIGGKWYYFAAFNFEPTYEYDAAAEAWVFNGVQERPYGSMYCNEYTPDGYFVDATGAWVQ